MFGPSSAFLSKTSGHFQFALHIAGQFQANDTLRPSDLNLVGFNGGRPDDLRKKQGVRFQFSVSCFEYSVLWQLPRRALFGWPACQGTRIFRLNTQPSCTVGHFFRGGIHSELNDDTRFDAARICDRYLGGMSSRFSSRL